MDCLVSDLQVPDAPTTRETIYSTANATLATLLEPNTESSAWLFCTIILIVTISYVLFQCLQYFTSELPPLGSGLKRLPGPISTLPYVGRVHDVDRMQAWHAMQKFSDQYDGGETHIWVAREDVAQDLLVKHAAISSARADLGAYPDVTRGNKYLPLLGYNGTCTVLFVMRNADDLQKLFIVNNASHMQQ
jgi:hypothetical protein